MSRTDSHSLPWHMDVSPGSGGMPPRSWYAGSDALRMSLNGEWRFRLSPTATAEDASFARSGFDASGWETVAVPGHWVCKGSAERPRTPMSSIRSRSTRRTCRPRTRPVTTCGPSICPTDGRRAATSCCGSTGWSPPPGSGSTARSWGTSRVRGCRTSSRSAPSCGPRATSWPSACTSGRPGAIWRTRTSGGCPGSSGTSRCCTGHRGRPGTSSCTPATTTAPGPGPCGWSATGPGAG